MLLTVRRERQLAGLFFLIRNEKRNNLSLVISHLSFAIAHCHFFQDEGRVKIKVQFKIEYLRVRKGSLLPLFSDQHSSIVECLRHQREQATLPDPETFKVE